MLDEGSYLPVDMKYNFVSDYTESITKHPDLLKFGDGYDALNTDPDNNVKNSSIYVHRVPAIVRGFRHIGRARRQQRPGLPAQTLEHVFQRSE